MSNKMRETMGGLVLLIILISGSYLIWHGYTNRDILLVRKVGYKEPGACYCSTVYNQWGQATGYTKTCLPSKTVWRKMYYVCGSGTRETDDNWYCYERSPARFPRLGE